MLTFQPLAVIMAPRRNRRLLQPQLPHQDRPRHNDAGIQVPGRHNRGDGFESYGWKLDRLADSEEGYRDQQQLVRHHGRWRCCKLSPALQSSPQSLSDPHLSAEPRTNEAQDCQYWLAYLGMQCRLHELRQKRRITVAAASKILANIVYSYKGMGLSMGTMCAGVTPSEGPALYYIDSDGTRLAGNLFCVGSGQTFAYGVLDAEYKYDLTEEEALELGRRSILAATHRDAYSGGYINLYHVKEEGWVKHGFNDTNPIFWKTKLEKGEFSNVTSELV